MVTSADREALVAVVCSGDQTSPATLCSFSIECTRCGRLDVPSKALQKRPADFRAAATRGRSRAGSPSTSNRRLAVTVAFLHGQLHGVDYREFPSWESWQQAKRDHKWDSMAAARDEQLTMGDDRTGHGDLSSPGAAV